MAPQQKEDKSKTQLIREYFLDRPNQVLSPSEVADDLGMDKHVTSTIVHRLEGDGDIQRAGRGEYIYKKEVDLETAATIYKTLYHGVARNIGLKAIETMTRMTENDFDQEEPLESIKVLALALKGWFGDEAVRNILTNLESASEDEELRVIIEEIKVEILKSD